MKIIRLEATNVKKLRAVSIDADGRPVIRISGRNGAGKSSTLDAVAFALGGERLVCEEPIRHGEDHAEVTVDLGDIIVTRRWTASGSTVRLQNREGATYPKPQARLDQLVGKIAFDPLAFASLDPKKQAETLRVLLGLDFTDQDAKRRGLYEGRTAANRQVDRLKAKFSGILAPAPDTPADEVSVAALMEERGRLEDTIRANELVRGRLRVANEEVSKAREAVVTARAAFEAAQKRLDEARAILATKESVASEKTAEVAQLVDPDLSEVTQRILAADTVNEAVRARKSRLATLSELEEARRDVAGITAKIDAIDEAKAAAIAAAKFPVPGLGFDPDGGLTLNGIPFDQAASSEKLRTSVAIGIAMNPTIKVLLIREASLLDAGNLAVIGQMAEEADAQVWCEIVGDGGDGAIVIEDGIVVGAEAPAA